MNDSKEQANNNANSDSGKTKKAFDSNMLKLVAIVGGNENLFPAKKVSGDVLTTVVEGLLKEDKENLEKEVKEGIKSLLTKHVELKKSLEAKKKELAQLEEQKMKEFNEAASKIFNKIESIDTLSKEFHDSLTVLKGNAEESKGE